MSTPSLSFNFLHSISTPCIVCTGRPHIRFQYKLKIDIPFVAHGLCFVAAILNLIYSHGLLERGLEPKLYRNRSEPARSSKKMTLLSSVSDGIFQKFSKFPTRPKRIYGSRLLTSRPRIRNSKWLPQCTKYAREKVG